jgi:hypothetical protein
MLGARGLYWPGAPSAFQPRLAARPGLEVLISSNRSATAGYVRGVDILVSRHQPLGGTP